MVDLKSKKAIYVRLQAAASCQIQFICKGNIIFTRYYITLYVSFFLNQVKKKQSTNNTTHMNVDKEG